MMSMKDLAHETVLHHEFRSYGKELIVDTCKMEDYYETMVMYPDGNELECVRNSELDKALEDHTRLHDKYRHRDGLLEKATLSGKYAKLREAFEKAYVAAASHQNDYDGGTCNFDRMWLHLQSHEEMRVVAAAKQAGLRAFKGNFLHKKVYFVEPPFGGQGYRRTKQAEAMCEAMKSLGYTAGMFYQMD